MSELILVAKSNPKKARFSMAIRIECPACDEHFAVADEDAGKKAACPSCGNINRIPAATTDDNPSPKQDKRPKSRLKVAQRLEKDEIDNVEKSPPVVQPPQLQPPVAQTQDEPTARAKEGSLVSTASEANSPSTPSGERRRRRKKTSNAWLWGTIVTGGVAIIGLALFANYVQNQKSKQTVADKGSAKTSSTTAGNNQKPKTQGRLDGQNQRNSGAGKTENTPVNNEIFAPFEEEKESDDPLVKNFQEADNLPLTEPEPVAPITDSFPDAVKSLFQQCQDLQWKPETLSDYAKLQGLATLVTACGRARESEVLDANQKEEMFKVALEVMEALATTGWGDHAQVTRINKFATEALQNQQELGVFAYSEVYALADGQLDGAKIVCFKLIGTDQHVAITVKENVGDLIPGSRWLILGEFNFLRAIQLTDGNTGNTIKAPLVTAYFVIEEPK